MIVRNDEPKPMSMRDIVSLFISIGQPHQKKPPDIVKDKHVSHTKSRR